MVSGAYKSNLLRFAVSQYRRGIARHRRALGRANSTVRLSAELGTALIVLPVYVAARASVSAGRRLNTAVKKHSPPILRSKARELLNFSDFEGATDGRTSDGLTSSSFANELDVSTGLVSSNPMFQTLVTVGRCLSTPQLVSLSNLSISLEGSGLSDTADAMPSQIVVSKNRPMHWVEKCRSVARQLLNFEKVALATVGSRLAASKPMQITGVASDVETRLLLLVLDYGVTWNGLSPAQQQLLQRQIATYVGSGSLVISQKTSVFNSAMHWFSVRKSVLRWLRWHKDNNQTEVASRLSTSAYLAELEAKESLVLSQGSSSLSDRLDVPSREPKLLCSSVGLPQTLDNACDFVCEEVVIRGDRTERYSYDAIEADVISNVYVEHPLEKVLKWVDRILLWLENRWPPIKQKLLLQIETVFHS